jgi:hypothetical protein
MKMEMGVNETWQNRLTFTIDHLRVLMAKPFEFVIPCYSRDFAISDGNPFGPWQGRIHCNDVGVI